MKCVVLVGGAATRLSPLTAGYNKHLLLLGDPGSGFTSVFRYSLYQLICSGIDDFLFITNPRQILIFHEIIRDFSKNYWFRYKIICSSKPDMPLPDVIYQAKDFVGKDNFILYLGDNLFFPFFPAISLLKMLISNDNSNVAVVTSSDELINFGVVEYSISNHARFIEKPSMSELIGNTRKYALTGLAKYTNKIFDTIEMIRLIQCTDPDLCSINNMLVHSKQLQIMHWNNRWYDIGTIKRYKRANSFFSEQFTYTHPELDSGLEISLLKETDLYLKVTSLINTESYALH
jgi:glucose-1-phosphate thymidylyltransferase